MKQQSVNKTEKVILTGMTIVLVLALLMSITSCSRYVSVDDAANGRARCGQSLR